jgi:hypothetical protein
MEKPLTSGRWMRCCSSTQSRLLGRWCMGGGRWAGGGMEGATMADGCFWPAELALQLDGC